MSDTKMTDAVCTPSNSGFDAGLAASEMVLGGGGYQLLEDMRLAEEADRGGRSTNNSVAFVRSNSFPCVTARKIPNYSISSLVYKDDGQLSDHQKADGNEPDDECSTSSDSRDKTDGPDPNVAVAVNMVREWLKVFPKRRCDSNIHCHVAKTNDAKMPKSKM